MVTHILAGIHVRQVAKICILAQGGLNVNERHYCCKQSVVMPVNLLGGAIFLPLVYSVQGQRSSSTKKSNKIIEIVTRKSDKNQLEPGWFKPQNISVGYSFHLLVLYENYLICIS